MEGLESKYGLAKLEVKEATTKGAILHIKAYALAFGNVDSWGDIIEAGACDDFLKSADADRMALCWQHDRSVVIGKITDKGVDAYGMWIEADILPTTAGNDAAILLKSGAVKEFSIGYRATKYRWEKREGYKYDIRVIEALTVYECSPVTIAANSAAVVVSAKSLGHETEKPDQNSINHNSPKAMTPEEIKAMRESIEKSVAEKNAAEFKALKDDIKAKQETIEAQEKSINNLDKSMKALQAKCDDLEKKAETKEQASFFGALKAALEAKKDEIKSMLESHRGSMKFEFEVKDVNPLATTQITNTTYGVALEPGIHSARMLANAFYNAFPKDTVRATQFNWLEGTFTDNADYVEELAKAKDDTAAVVEKSRLFGKLAAHLRVSSEVADFFEEVYNWARNTAQLKIAAKLDNEIFQGAGADSGAGTSTKKVYGLKSQATAFAATGAKYKAATIADVILDMQVQALKEGYTIDKVFVSYVDFANIRGLKNANGNYMYNEVTGMLNGVSIIPTVRLASGQLMGADSTIVRIKERPVWELEIVRNAELDGWDVYVRKAAQTLVKTNDKKGLIWVADVAAAITAIKATNA